jgi:hypothetical protein
MTYSYSTSTNALLFHPLLVKASAHARTQWECNTDIQNIESYQIKKCDIREDPEYKITEEDMMRLRTESKNAIRQWCLLHSVFIEGSMCAMIDTRSHEVYPVDLIARKHDKAQIITIFYTKKRIPKHRYDGILQYTKDLHEVCIQLYALCPTTLALNIYPKTTDGVETMDVIQISRAQWSGQRRRRQAGGGVSVTATTRIPLQNSSVQVREALRMHRRSRGSPHSLMRE